MFKLLNDESRAFLRFCGQRQTTLVAPLIFIALLCYGFKLANYSLSIDEEYLLKDGSLPGAWISQGRFGTGLIKWLLHTAHVVPFWSTFLSVALLTLSALVWCFILDQSLVNKSLSAARKKA